jgi:hypothetical protein
MKDGIEGGEFGFLAGLKENLELASIRCYHVLNCEEREKAGCLDHMTFSQFSKTFSTYEGQG